VTGLTVRRVIARWLLCVTAVIGLMQVAAVASGAQPYPTATVRMVFGLSPGSSSDVMARILAERVSEKWGKPVVIENRPGAGGNIAADVVSKSTPDGHTLLLTNVSIAIAPSFYRKLNYDPVKDLVAVTGLGIAPHVLCVNPALPIKSVRDLIAAAKAKPGELMFSSAGVGQTDHMATELFAQMAGIRMTHIPYKGGPPALQAVMTGEVTLDFPGVAAALPFMRSGMVRCLAVTTKTRSSVVPDLPTLQEEGIQGYEHSLWNGIFAPTGTPPEIIAKVSADFAEVLKRPDIIERLAGLGIDSLGNNPKEFNTFFQAEVTKWATVIKTIGIAAD
jgi:tripartite-type tricarboxylate transporter receptor subunit TctC